ncbi:MAG: glutamate mutase L, partial [Chloroflexota bacterium]
MTENGSRAFKPSSLLTLDIGSVNTRAAMFDVVENRYRFLASGIAPSTANAPIFDVGEGVSYAIEQLQKIAGRRLLDRQNNLLIPANERRNGADKLAVTFSAGSPLKTVVAGLLDKVSLTSALNLSQTTYTNIVEKISIGAESNTESRIDKILRIQPELIIIAGGTDDGASSSVLKLVNTLGMALYLMPLSARPEVLFAGNQALAPEVSAFLSEITKVHIASNIRPSLSVEQLGPAQHLLADVF